MGTNYLFVVEKGQLKGDRIRKPIPTKWIGGRHEYKYKRKDCFLTPSEHKFFNVLMEAMGGDYHIFPQLHLSAIVDHKVPEQDYEKAFYHVNQKSVDFVLCDKKTLKPLLAIELDDPSHGRQERVQRDRTVESILKKASSPLLRLKNVGHCSPSEIAQKINNALGE